MAINILSTTENVTPPDKIISGINKHIAFLREGGTHAVIIQQGNNEKDLTDDSNWHNVGYIGPTTDTDFENEQGLAIFATDGYSYRVRLDTSSTNTDTEVSYGQQLEGPGARNVD